LPIGAALSKRRRRFVHGGYIYLFSQAFELYFEDATVLYDYFPLVGGTDGSLPPTDLTRVGKIIRPESSSEGLLDAFVAELPGATGPVENGSPSPLLDGTIAADGLLLCYRETGSVRTGRFIDLASSGVPCFFLLQNSWQRCSRSRISMVSLKSACRGGFH
jgi:hypothetical protein